MKTNQVVIASQFTQLASSDHAPCIGRSVLLHASVRGTGAVSAAVKVQGSNTPDVAASWVDIGLQVTASGTTNATASSEGVCQFAYVRQVLTALTGVEAVSSLSSK